MRISQVTKALALARSIDRPVMLWGPPGIGKSAVIKQFADEQKIERLDWRLTLMDQVDMRGTPFRVTEKGVEYTKWAAPYELPRGGSGVLQLDELPQARMEVKNVAAMLVLEKRIGEWKLPPGWWIVGAGNRTTDGAGTSPMPTHLNNRFWHIDVDVSNEDWLEWAMAHDIDYRVVANIKFTGDALHDFDPKSKDAAFATPRAWEGVSDIVKQLGSERDILAMDPDVLSEMISGNVGRKYGEMFVGFMRVMHSLVTMDQILSSPETAPIPTEASVRYALMTGLTKAVKKENIAKAFTYAVRMGKEMAFVFARKLDLEQPALRKTAAFTQFCAANADFI